MLRKVPLKCARSAFTYIKKGRGKKVGIIVGTKRSRWLLDTNSETFLLQGVGIFENVVYRTIAYLRNSPKLHENMIFETGDKDLFPDIRLLLSSAGYAVFKLESEESFRNMDMFCNSLITKRTAIFIYQPLLIHFLEKLQSIIFTRFEDFIFPTTTAFFISQKNATDGIVPISVAAKRNLKFIVNIPTGSCDIELLCLFHVVIKNEQKNNFPVTTVYKVEFNPVEIYP